MVEHALATRVVPQILAVATLKIARAITKRLVEKIAQQVQAQKSAAVATARAAESASVAATSAAVEATTLAVVAAASVATAQEVAAAQALAVAQALAAAQALAVAQALAAAQASVDAASVAMAAASSADETVSASNWSVEAVVTSVAKTAEEMVSTAAVAEITTKFAVSEATTTVALAEIVTTADTERPVPSQSSDHGAKETKLDSILTQAAPLELSFEQEQNPTQLMLAAFQGYMAAAKMLLASGQQVDEETSCGSTALLFAVRGGQAEMATFLLSRGASVSQINNHGWSPLLEACAKGDVDIAETLLEHGASAQQVDEEGSGALIVSSRNGRVEVVRLLLDRSAGKHSLRKTRQCPILNRSDKKLLIQLDLNATNVMGYTALMLASQCGHEPVVKLLLVTGASVRQMMEREGYTALHFACGNGHAAVAGLLLSHGGDLFAASSSLASPLSSTASSTSRPHSDSRGGGYTALHLACANGKLDTTRLLLKHDSRSRSVGVDESPRCDGTTLIEYPAGDGTTALMAAAQHGRCDLAHLLLLEGKGGGSSDTISGVGGGGLGGSTANVRVIGNLANASGKARHINAQQCDGWTALMFAVEGGYSEFAMLLLLQGANPGCRSYSKGETALMIAASHGDDALIKLLLLHGGDVHERGVGGKTPLLLAIESANVVACRVILEHGALEVTSAQTQQHADLEIQQQQMGMGREEQQQTKTGGGGGGTARNRKSALTFQSIFRSMTRGRGGGDSFGCTDEWTERIKGCTQGLWSAGDGIGSSRSSSAFNPVLAGGCENEEGRSTENDTEFSDCSGGTPARPTASMVAATRLPLQLACGTGQVEVVRLLMDWVAEWVGGQQKGGKVEIGSKFEKYFWKEILSARRVDGVTLLMQACAKNHAGRCKCKQHHEHFVNTVAVMPLPSSVTQYHGLFVL
jgi:serine/threonine-protein phosphatase 6 regulatory ankyrin repeat subunit B